MGPDFAGDDNNFCFDECVNEWVRSKANIHEKMDLDLNLFSMMKYLLRGIRENVICDPNLLSRMRNLL